MNDLEKYLGSSAPFLKEQRRLDDLLGSSATRYLRELGEQTRAIDALAQFDANRLTEERAVVAVG